MNTAAEFDLYVKVKEEAAAAQAAYNAIASLKDPKHDAELKRLKKDADQKAVTACRESLIREVDTIARAAGLRVPGTLRGLVDDMIEIDYAGSASIIHMGITISPAAFVQFAKGNQLMSGQSAFLFEGHTATGSGTANIFQGKQITNPWKKETRNLTMQAKIMEHDKALAQRLRTEAGQ